MSNSSIWPIDRTLSGATTPDHRGAWSEGDKGLHHIPQSSGITGASPSEYLDSYLGLSLKEFYPSAGMQLHSTALAY